MANRDNDRENDKDQDKRGDNGSDRRGFASMDENKRREIASMGGKAAHQKGTAHEFTPEEARRAGREGGKKSGQNRQNRDDNSR